MGRSGQLICTNDALIYELLQDPNYEVRDDGTVWTRVTRTGKISADDVWRQAGTSRRGYTSIRYRNKSLQLHRVIYAKFHGPLENDLVVNHIDDNGLNNRPENLELVTQSQNNFHRFRPNDGKPAVMGNKVLSWKIVRDIRELRFGQGWTLSAIGEKFDISKGHVSDIINNHIWIEGKIYAGDQTEGEV